MRLPTLDLPAEIWISIHRLATHVPYFLVTYTTDLPPHQRLDPHAVTGYLQGSLTAKRNLVLVCKLWYAWCIPFLYEGVVIRGFSDIVPLIRTLQGVKGDLDQAHTSGVQEPLGQLVRRLDIVSMASDGKITTNHIWESVSNILRCLPNLKMWIISYLSPLWTVPPIISSVVDTLIQTCGHSLEILYWIMSGPISDDFARLLSSTPNLRILQCAVGIDPSVPANNPSAVAPAYPTPILSKLTSVFIAPSFFTKRPGSPRIVDLISSSPIQSIKTTQLSTDRMQEIFSAHGSRLTYFNVHYTGLTYDIPWLLRALHNQCPNVKHLHLTFPSTGWFTWDIQLPPSVEVFSLFFGLIEDTPTSWDELVSTAEAIKGNGLKTFLLLNLNQGDSIPRDPSSPTQELSLNALQKHFESIGVNFWRP